MYFAKCGEKMKMRENPFYLDTTCNTYIYSTDEGIALYKVQYR